MIESRFNMSFTVGGLLLSESLLLAAIYLGTGDWQQVRDRVNTENLLQIRTQSGRERVGWEVVARLKMLARPELSFLPQADPQDQRYLLWLAICRRYRFIAEFAEEVLREQFISRNSPVGKDDYDTFFNRKAEWHPALDKLTPATQNRLRANLFKILRDVGLIAKDGTIQPVLFSPSLQAVMNQGNRQDLRFFPGLIV